MGEALYGEGVLPRAWTRQEARRNVRLGFILTLVGAGMVGVAVWFRGTGWEALFLPGLVPALLGPYAVFFGLRLWGEEDRRVLVDDRGLVLEGRRGAWVVPWAQLLAVYDRRDGVLVSYGAGGQLLPSGMPGLEELRGALVARGLPNETFGAYHGRLVRDLSRGLATLVGLRVVAALILVGFCWLAAEVPWLAAILALLALATFPWHVFERLRALIRSRRAARREAALRAARSHAGHGLEASPTCGPGGEDRRRDRSAAGP